jgi:transcriptional regulator with XRE-family HTH domain
MSVGDNIRNARISQGLNQKELVEKLAEKGINVGNTTISNWEKGISKPDPDTITTLCEILNVDANYILGFYQNKSKNNIEEMQILLDAYQGLSDTDKEFMRNMIIERRKLIDKQLEEKGQ